MGEKKDVEGSQQNGAAGTDSSVVNIVLKIPSSVLVAVCISGIFFFFVAAGAAHERLFSVAGVVGQVNAVGSTMGGEEVVVEKFIYSIFLVFVCCLSNCLLSIMAIFLFHGYKGTCHLISKLDYYTWSRLGIASVSYVVSLLASNYALTVVNYPTQVLVKSAKTVPIVVGGFVQYRKIYPWYDYLTVVAVTTGLTVFNLEKLYRSTKTASSHSVEEAVVWGASEEAFKMACGILLLVVSLVCDGVTGPTQDQLLAKRPMLSGLVVMLLMNVYGLMISGCAFVLFENLDALQFCMRNPSCWYYIGWTALATGLGQFCIFWGLTLMGSLHLAMVTTLRKFCSIVTSIVLHKHHVNFIQWTCIAGIFGCLALQSYCSNLHKTGKKKIHDKKELKENREGSWNVTVVAAASERLEEGWTTVEVKRSKGE